MSLIWVITIFMVLLAFRMPLAFSLGIAGSSYFLFSDFLPFEVAVQRMVSASQSFPLLAVPFFILAGQLMNSSGITASLVHLSRLLVSWINGGLAHVTVLLSVTMGGVAGSAVADASMQARVLGPAMVQSGLPKGFAAASLAISSLITATIPPSIGLILYGFMGNVSIGQLFLAGVIPGLLMAVALMLAIFWVAKWRKFELDVAVKPSTKAVAIALWQAKWALLFPILLIVTIRFGFFTPSEAGAFAVVYAFLVGFAHKKFTFKSLYDSLSQSVSDIGMVMLIILSANISAYAIAFEQFPQTLTEALLTIELPPTLMLLAILGFLALIGMFMEATVIVLLLTPILVPVVSQMGFDPVHFGVLMMIVVTLGGMTPPVGVAMYAVCGILKCSVERYVIDAMPLFLAVFLLVVLLVQWPDLVMFLPNGLAGL